jgi:predicted component of type VI protein secretion system
MGPLGIASLPPAIVADPWSTDNQFSQPDPLQPIQDIQVHRGNGTNKAASSNGAVNAAVATQATSSELPQPLPDQTQQPQPSAASQPPQATPGPVGAQVTELNNAYEGALEGLGLDNGLEYAMGVDMNMWVPGNGDWMTPEFMNGGVGL